MLLAALEVPTLKGALLGGGDSSGRWENAAAAVVSVILLQLRKIHLQRAKNPVGGRLLLSQIDTIINGAAGEKSGYFCLKKLSISGREKRLNVSVWKCCESRELQISWLANSSRGVSHSPLC